MIQTKVTEDLLFYVKEDELNHLNEYGTSSNEILNFIYCFLSRAYDPQEDSCLTENFFSIPH